MFVTAAYAAAEQSAEASGVFPPFDQSTYASQLFWLAVTFGLFYIFMSKVLVPRVGGILENRRDRIAHDIDEANRLSAESDQAIAIYEQELADAKANAQNIAQIAQNKAKDAADKKRQKAEEKFSERILEAEKKIADIKTAALGEVGTIASETAEAVVAQLTGGKLTKAQLTAAVKAANPVGN